MCTRVPPGLQNRPRAWYPVLEGGRQSSLVWPCAHKCARCTHTKPLPHFTAAIWMPGGSASPSPDIGALDECVGLDGAGPAAQRGTCLQTREGGGKRQSAMHVMQEAGMLPCVSRAAQERTCWGVCACRRGRMTWRTPNKHAQRVVRMVSSPASSRRPCCCGMLPLQHQQACACQRSGALAGAGVAQLLLCVGRRQDGFQGPACASTGCGQGRDGVWASLLAREQRHVVSVRPNKAGRSTEGCSPSLATLPGLQHIA